MTYEPRCWICNRKMKLNGRRGDYWLHCGPCAATYMDAQGMGKEEFLACYARFYRKKRNGDQMEMEFDD